MNGGWQLIIEEYRQHNKFLMEQIKEKNIELKQLRQELEQYKEK
ncbi:hypothetical protein [Virgibacillus halodenitrificans]|nr:hypothetical protein [Virgibacillus halodenitrificans]